MELPDSTVVILAVPVVFLGMLLLIFTLKKQYQAPNSDVGTLTPGIAVVIPFRNEGENLIDQAGYFSKLFGKAPSIPIHWVDDYSTDDLRAFTDFIADKEHFHLIRSSEKPGKKRAVKYALQTVNADWVFLMDVDSRPDVAILSADYVNMDSPQKMLLVPIRPKPSPSLIRKFFDLDFISLHFAGFKSVALKRPLLANGAAMMVNRTAYLQSLRHRTDWDIDSGDDVFAMMAIKSEFGSESIGALPLETPGVEVSFPDILPKLWSQRSRWVSKVGNIKGGWFQFVSWVVLTGTLVLLPLVYIGIRDANPVAIALFVFLVLAEVIYLLVACVKLRRRDLIWVIIPAIPLYPFYLVGIIATRIFGKSTWK